MLKAGAACLDITPPLGTLIPGYFHERRAGAVHDALFVRAFALENGGSGIAVAVCDLIGVLKHDSAASAKVRCDKSIAVRSSS